MKFVFGNVPTEFLEDGEHFKSFNTPGEFYFKLEFEQEADGYGDVRISDTSGRCVPIDLESIPELIRILSVIQEYREDQVEFKNYWATRLGYKG